MSEATDVLDDQIRGVLRARTSDAAEPSEALGVVLRRASVRRRRARSAAVVGFIAAVGLSVPLLATEDRPTITTGEGDVTDQPPATTTAVAAAPLFDPSLPLLEEPLPVIPQTQLTTVEGWTMTFEATARQFILALDGPGPGSGSMSGDYVSHYPAIVSGGSSSSPDPNLEGPVPVEALYGEVRPEVTRIEWVRGPGNAISVETIAHPAIPQLRFFLILDPSASTTGPWRLLGYAADGTLLTDTDQQVQLNTMAEWRARPTSCDQACQRSAAEARAQAARERQGGETQPALDAAETATAADLHLIRSFLQFAADAGPANAAAIGWADQVALGLGSELHLDRTRDELANASQWSIDIDGYFRAAEGPFSALETAATSQRVMVSVGQHDHCASPPMPAPAAVAELRRVSVQPSPDSIDSCLAWWTVDLFVTPDGQVAAVTLDLWEP